MHREPIRPAFSAWAALNARLVDHVESLGADELALTAGPGRWPVWAIIGHAACQRVFWLCDFAGEPGAETTPFTQAAWTCPGDEDLVNVLDAAALVHALTSTFAIVEGVLAGWSFDDLGEVLARPEWGPDWVHTRGAVIQRVHDHDLWHAADASEVLSLHGRPGIEIWK